MVPLQIQREELHLWWVNLREFDAQANALRCILSFQEETRAKQFRFLYHRKNYVIAHGILRILLAGYVGARPSGLEFTTGAHGKPELRSGYGEPRIHFNLSHSRDVAVYGFTSDCPIGVDVEYLDPVPDCEQIARQFFNQADAESLMAMPGDLRHHRFFDLWTRREALLKATGEGLVAGGTTPDNLSSVTCASGFGDVQRAPKASAEWCVRSFSPLPGYVGAVAHRKSHLRIFRCGVPFLPAGSMQYPPVPV